MKTLLENSECLNCGLPIHTCELGLCVWCHDECLEEFHQYLDSQREAEIEESFDALFEEFCSREECRQANIEAGVYHG